MTSHSWDFIEQGMVHLFNFGNCLNDTWGRGEIIFQNADSKWKLLEEFGTRVKEFKDEAQIHSTISAMRNILVRRYPHQ